MEYRLERAMVSLERANFQQMLAVKEVHDAQIDAACRPLQTLVERMLPYLIQIKSEEQIEDLLFGGLPELDSYKQLLTPLIKKACYNHSRSFERLEESLKQFGDTIEWTL